MSRFAFASRRGDLVRYTDTKRPSFYLVTLYRPELKSWTDFTAHRKDDVGDYFIPGDILPEELAHLLPPEEWAALVAMSIEIS